jgi:hypothetical protein
LEQQKKISFQCCEPVLIKGQRDAYEKFDKKFDEMKQSNITTDLLQQKFVSIKETWELLNEKILRVEIQWDNLIVCLVRTNLLLQFQIKIYFVFSSSQNYYLALTASKSAKENLINTMIRPKSDVNLLDFFNQQIFPKLDKMTKYVPDIQSFNYGVDALRKKVNGLITQNLEFVWLNARFQMRFDEMLKSVENETCFKTKKHKIIDCCLSVSKNTVGTGELDTLSARKGDIFEQAQCKNASDHQKNDQRKTVVQQREEVCIYLAYLCSDFKRNYCFFTAQL